MMVIVIMAIIINDNDDGDDHGDNITKIFSSKSVMKLRAHIRSDNKQHAVSFAIRFQPLSCIDKSKTFLKLLKMLQS